MKRYIVLFMVSCVLIGCGTNRTEMEKEYETIKQSDLSGQKLVITMTNFELNNSAHFDSKVDLGVYYKLMGDYETARGYLKRAEGVVKNAPPTDEGNKSVCSLYALLAQIEFFSRSSFAEAERYAKKAIDAHSEYGEDEYYLLGQSQLAQDKNEEDLKTFDFIFDRLPEIASPDDLRAYLHLLVDSKRVTEGVPILEKYFETGEYFTGLGISASAVFEAAGEIEKSILSIFLEWEFYSNFSGEGYEQFMQNLDNMEIYLQSCGKDAVGVPVFQLIRSVYDNGITVEDTFSSFFAARYCVLIRKIMDNTVTSDDLEEYLSLEKYFRQFPVYHWNGWAMAKMLDPSDLPNHAIMLEKIIALKADEFSVNNAKHELGALFGLDESASESILTKRELRLLVSEYVQTGNHTLFDRIYALLELPDNSYVTHAVEYLKDNREEYFFEDPAEYLKFNKQEYVLEDILRAKLQTADGLLQERLEYILK